MGIKQWNTTFFFLKYCFNWKWGVLFEQDSTEWNNDFLCPKLDTDKTKNCKIFSFVQDQMYTALETSFHNSMFQATITRVPPTDGTKLRMSDVTKSAKTRPPSTKIATLYQIQNLTITKYQTRFCKIWSYLNPLQNQIFQPIRSFKNFKFDK